MKLTGRTGVIVSGTVATVFCLVFWNNFRSARSGASKNLFVAEKSRQIWELGSLCRLFAAEHAGGKFPESLDALREVYPDKIESEGFFVAENEKGERKPFVYHVGLSTCSSPDLPLIEYPFPLENRRIVGYVAGNVRVIRE